MADGTTESLFLTFPTYDHSKRIRRDSHLSSLTVQNSFSYSSGLELTSHGAYHQNSLISTSDNNIGFIDQQPSNAVDFELKDVGRRNFEAFYDSLNTNGFSSVFGLGSGFHGNARSIQNAIENHNMPPSKVLHCRAVADGCKETDIVAAMRQFGKIKRKGDEIDQSHRPDDLRLSRSSKKNCINQDTVYLRILKALTLMPKLRQALVEFETPEESSACIQYAKISPIMVLGRQMYVNFSKSQEINRDFSSNNGSLVETPTNVLLFTIINAIHPINVDIVRKICSAYAEVQRIVIFHKNGLQALAEYPFHVVLRSVYNSSEEALTVRKALNRCDIYAGCCTLKIDFSKTGRLNVHANSNETYDIEIENRKRYYLTNDKDSGLFSERSSTSSYSSPSYQNGSLSSTPGPSPSFNTGSMLTASLSDTVDVDNVVSRPTGYPRVQSSSDLITKTLGKHASSSSTLGSLLSDSGLTNSLADQQLSQSKSSLLAIQQNATDCSSAFASYGRSLSLAGGEGCVAMVYGVNTERMNCDRLFNLFCLYGNVVKVKVLTNKLGAAMIQYTDKMSTDIAIRNLNNLTLFANKFQLSFSKHPFIADASQISRLPDSIHPPSKVLHYFNAPADCTEEQLSEVFNAVGAEIPLKQATFSKAAGQVKSSSGLLEFSTVPTAVEALILANHFTMHREGGGAFTLKLAFSPSSTINS
eukprot:gene13887-15335_t